jgi:hypothetical protein
MRADLAAGILALSVVLPVNALDVGGLEPLVAAATGIQRSVDGELQNRAAHRASEIQSDWSHCCLMPGEAEVLAYNAGYPNPLEVMVAGWMASPTHLAILSDPDYTRIGCAWDEVDGGFWGVCLLAVASPHTEPVLGTSEPLPNTALPRN